MHMNIIIHLLLFNIIIHEYWTLIISDNFVNFFDVLFSFRCAKATTMLVVFHLFSLIFKTFMPLKTSSTCHDGPQSTFLDILWEIFLI